MQTSIENWGLGYHSLWPLYDNPLHILLQHSWTYGNAISLYHCLHDGCSFKNRQQQDPEMFPSLQKEQNVLVFILKSFCHSLTLCSKMWNVPHWRIALSIKHDMIKCETSETQKQGGTSEKQKSIRLLNYIVHLFELVKGPVLDP